MATVSLQWILALEFSNARNATIPPGMVAQSKKSLFQTILRFLLCFAFCLLCHATTTMGLSIGMSPIINAISPMCGTFNFWKKENLWYTIPFFTPNGVKVFHYFPLNLALWSRYVNVLELLAQDSHTLQKKPTLCCIDNPWAPDNTGSIFNDGYSIVESE